MTACYILAYFSDETTLHISCSRHFVILKPKIIGVEIRTKWSGVGRGSFPPPPYIFPFPSLPPVTCAQERPERIDLFTDTTAILNLLVLRSIMGCPGGMSTFRYTRSVFTRAFRAIFSLPFPRKRL